MNVSRLLAVVLLGLSGLAQARPVVTLPTVEVRPSVEQLAQREHERRSAIPTLATVEVRPTAAIAPSLVPTLATVQVRPSPAQYAEREAIAESRRHWLSDAAARAGADLRQILPRLPLPALDKVVGAVAGMAELR